MDQRQLQGVLFAAARELLAGVDGAQTGPVWVEIRNNHARVELTQREPEPLRDNDTATLHLLEGCFVTAEQGEVIRLLAHGSMTTEEIAEHLHISLTKLKILLAALVDRGVLDAGRRGYTVRHPVFIKIADRLSNP